MGWEEEERRQISSVFTCEKGQEKIGREVVSFFSVVFVLLVVK